jgi:putative copper export protein
MPPDPPLVDDERDDAEDGSSNCYISLPNVTTADMRTLYLGSIWLHILAATIWVGGMLFLVLVIAPWLRGGGRAHALAVLREAGRRFRIVGWVCFAVLLVTGSYGLWMRGVRLESFAAPEWRASAFGQLVLLKIGLFGAVLAISVLHDFVLGPRATKAIELDPSSESSRRLRRRAAWVGRLNAALGLVIVLIAVMLVRGAP